MHFVTTKKLKGFSFITVVDINVRNFSYLRLTHTRTKQHTNKQTNKHNGTRIHL